MGGAGQVPRHLPGQLGRAAPRRSSQGWAVAEMRPSPWCSLLAGLSALCIPGLCLRSPDKASPPLLLFPQQPSRLVPAFSCGRPAPSVASDPTSSLLRSVSVLRELRQSGQGRAQLACFLACRFLHFRRQLSAITLAPIPRLSFPISLSLFGNTCGFREAGSALDFSCGAGGLG